MKRLITQGMIFVVVAMMFSANAGTVTVTSVTAQQRYPWNGLVDITVTINGSEGDQNITECVFAATNSATKAAIPVAHITRNWADAGSGNVWTRKYIWDATADVGAVRIDDVALSVDVKLIGVQLWENGPYWAECNVGATKPEESGYYFWWGDTVGYKQTAAKNGWESVKDGAVSILFSNDSPANSTMSKDKAALLSEGYIDATGNLVTTYDAATAHLGAPWRMPTGEEFSSLIKNCTTTWTKRNGVSGRLIKGRGAYASRSVFLPAVGYGAGSSLNVNLSGYLLGCYWSSTPDSSDSNYAQYFQFHLSGFAGYNDRRCCGYVVRPVRGLAK